MRRLLLARRLEHSRELTLHLTQLQFLAHEGLHPRSRRLTRLTHLTRLTRLTRLLMGASLLQRPLSQQGACLRLQRHRLHYLLHRKLFLLSLAPLLEETLASAAKAPQQQGSEQGTYKHRQQGSEQGTYKHAPAAGIG